MNNVNSTFFIETISWLFISFMLQKLEGETVVDGPTSTQHCQILLSQPKLKSVDYTASNVDSNSPAQRPRNSCFKSGDTHSTEGATSTIVTCRQTQIF